MKLPSSQRSNMRHCAIPCRFMFPADFQLPSPSSTPDAPNPQTVYDAWLTSREMPGKHGAYLVPGAPRALTLQNAWLALFVCQTCILDFVRFIPSTLSPKKLTIFLAVQSPLDTQSSKDNSNDGIEHYSKSFPSLSRIFSGSPQAPLYLMT
jgi:hypothetical protein